MALSRGAEPLLQHLLDSTKVVILEGGRGVGKTTLAKHIAATRGFGSTFDLSDPADRETLTRDPHRVLAVTPGPVLIDEAQLVPELTVAVKRRVDESAETGQVLLTGSSRIGRGALGGGDPLAGRAVRLRLHSFTQGELAGGPLNAVERWWSEDPVDAVHPELELDDLHRRMVTGGLPTVAIGQPVTFDADQHRRLFDTYVDGVLTMALAGTRTDRSRLLRAFRYLASNPGQILNINRAASELSVRAETVQRYLDLCRDTFLLDVAPAHRPTQAQTVTAHPRLFTGDPALAAWAAETSPAALLREPRLAGSLLENFVAHELRAQSDWKTPTALLHWRDARAGREVDIVLRRANGEMLAVEVKSASSVSAADTKGLSAFAERAQGRVVRSLIVYTGRATQQLGSGIWAVPLSSLIGAPPASASGATARV